MTSALCSPSSSCYDTMTSRGNSGPRVLGNIKVKGTVFPPLPRAANDLGRHLIVENQLLVQGDSMGLPTFISKGGDSPSKPAHRPVTSKSDAIANIKLAEEIRELQSQERHYKTKVQSLQKIIEQLRQDVTERDGSIASLNRKLQEIEMQYKRLFEEESTEHKRTKTRLEGVSQELAETRQLVEDLKKKHEESIQEMTALHEKEFCIMDEERKRALSEKDETIEKMKKQMAAFLKGNSVERQQQLEELARELGKVSEEADGLKMKLKSLLKQRKCEGCDLLKQELMKRDGKISEQEATIKELMAICQKFERQLSQQDVLLVHFQQSELSKMRNIRKK